MLHKIKNFQTLKPDFVGISASLLCMVHCTFYPFLISLGILMKATDTGPRYFGTKYQHAHIGWHWIDYLFVAMAIWAVFNAVKSTHSYFIKIGLWASVTVFSFAILLHHLSESMLYVSLSASLVLLIFHILNWKNDKNYKFYNK